MKTSRTALVAVAILLICADAAFALDPQTVSGVSWYVFSGDASPAASGFVEDAKLPGAAAATLVNGDGTVTFDLSKDAGAKAGWSFAPALGDSFPKAFTLLIRVKAEAGVARAFDLDLRFADLKTPAAGPRAKFIVSNKELQIEKPDGVNSSSTVKYPLETTKFHVYQLSCRVSAADMAVSVFVDGAPVPAMTAKCTALYPENSIWLGDNGSNPCKAVIDYLIWTPSGAFSPADIAGKLPAGIAEAQAR
jgi:hypothetical protein